MSHREQALLKWRDGVGGELGENELTAVHWKEA